MSDSLWPQEPQHARPPCPSPTPGVYTNPCPLTQWCHPTISSSVIPFSSCPQSFPALGSFQISQLSASGGQSIGVSSSTSVLPMNTQDWSPLGWTGWISLQSKGLSSLFQHYSSKALILWHSAFFIVKAVVFPVVMYGCESWIIKKAECRRTDAFEVCWRRLLRVPWTVRRSNQSIL